MYVYITPKTIIIYMKLLIPIYMKYLKTITVLYSYVMHVCP